MRKARGTAASPSLIANTDDIGSLVWLGHDGSSFQSVASIFVTADGATGSGNIPTRMVFHTSPTGSAALTERMRITNEGKIGIGTTAPNNLLHLSNTGVIQFALTDSDAGADLKHRYIQSANGTMFFGKMTDAFGAFDQMALDTNGKLGIGTQTPTVSGTGKLHAAGNTARPFDTAQTPASNDGACNTGEIAYDTSFIYVCLGGGDWKRAALSDY